MLGLKLNHVSKRGPSPGNDWTLRNTGTCGHMSLVLTVRVRLMASPGMAATEATGSRQHNLCGKWGIYKANSLHTRSFRR